MWESVLDLVLLLFCFLDNRIISNEDLIVDCIFFIRKICVETVFYREIWKLFELVGILEEISDLKKYNVECVLWLGSKDKRIFFDFMIMVIDYFVMKMNNCNF